MADFEPRIVAFVCNWCSYAGADTAGGKKLDCPPNVSTIRMMCSGRVDPQFVMEAYREGADGVMVLGCHPGDCHYRSGNTQAMRRVALLERMLPQFGIDRRRLMLDWVGAAEGDRFRELTRAMTEAVRALGRLHLTGTVEARVTP